MHHLFSRFRFVGAPAGGLFSSPKSDRVKIGSTNWACGKL